MGLPPTGLPPMGPVAMAEPSPAPGGPALAGSYARWRSRRLGQVTDRLQETLVLELLGPVADCDVLDVGCGDGALAATLSRRGARMVGLDPDPRMLAAARGRAEAGSLGLTLVPGRAEALPFPAATFDRVVAVTALCFVPEADRAVAEMVRVLRPGGRLVLGELGRWSIWAAIRTVRGWLGAPTWRAAHFRSAADLRRLVERHGLTVGETRGSTFYPPLDVAAALMERCDPWLGRRTTVGAAFVALSAARPGGRHPSST